MLLNRYFSISLYGLGLLFASGKVSVAQVTPDNFGTRVDTNGNVAEITGGETRGSNLFHSFQDFSVPTNNEAFFNNSNNVSNIFSRVTGGNVSNIDGLIRANGSASLFLINPAGIMFGENASLNLGGSFYGSTADSILFEDGEFSAANPDATPLLTINAPIGFNFRDNPGDITGSQATLGVNNGQDLFLIGGNLNFDGLILGSFGGRVELGALTGSGAIAFDENGNLDFPEAVTRGNVSLSNSAGIVVTGEGGSVNINARNLSVTSDSSILAGINDDSGFSDARAGDVVINLTEDLVLDNSNISNSVSEAVGNAGNINIKARDVTFSNGGRIFNINFGGEGNIGDVVIMARDIIFDGTSDAFQSGITNLFVEEATGNIGEINLTAQNFSVTNGANIISNVIGNSNSGNININIADTITLDGFGTTTNANGESIVLPSIISSNAFGNGNSGDINLNVQNLFLSRNGRIEAIAGTGGNAGNIDINAESITIGEPGNTELLPSSINVSVGISFIDNDSDTIANSGNVNINTGSLRINDGGNIDASIFDGNGGNIAINAREEVSIAGSGTLLNSSGQEVELPSSILADINPGGSGRAGRIEINAASLSIDEGSISADVFGDGDGGEIELNISDSIELSNFSRVDADVAEGSTGNGGNLNIETGRLIIDDASSISVSTFSSGNAGNINIVAKELITLSGAIETSRGGIFASALISDGKGGNVNLTTGELAITDGAIITASNFSSRGEASGGFAPGTGEPGNITIAAESLRLSEGRIEAITQAETGQGANIDLQIADNIFLTGDSLISAEARGNANGGNLNIDTDFILAFDGNNDIIARADRGTGGKIDITAESLWGIQERPLSPTTNDINASSEFGIDGNVSIGVLDLYSFKNVIESTTAVVKLEETVARSCGANRESTAQSSLVIEGKGGISSTPDLPLDSTDMIIEPDSTFSSLPQPLKTSRGNIQPARGIQVTKEGIMLTAYRTNNKGDRLRDLNTNCGVRDDRG